MLTFGGPVLFTVDTLHLEESLAYHKHSHVYRMNERDFAFILKSLSTHERFLSSTGMFEIFP